MTVQEPAWVKLLINSYIAGLKADGTWPLLDWQTLPLGSAQASLVNLKQPAKVATNVGATFTAYRGFTGDGVNGRVDFGELPTAAGNGYALNSAMIFAYCNLQGGTTAGGTHCGPLVDSNTGLTPQAALGTVQARLNDVTSTQFTTALTRTGSYMAVRPDAATKRVFFNGAASSTGDAAVASTAAPTSNMCLLVRGGAEVAGTLDQIASGGSGAAISNAQAISMQSRLHALMTALGANY
jgi:hypothetical protein